LISTKANNRGIGTQNVRSIVNKYEGSLNFDFREGLFITKVYLQCVL